MSGLSSSLSKTSAELRLFADPKLFAQRLEQLEKAQTEAERVIALAGPASEIVKMREDIEKELEVQRATSDKAQTEANRLLSAARDEAFKVVADAQAQGERLREQAEARLEEARQTLESATRSKNLHDTRRAELAKEEETLRLKIIRVEEQAQALEGERSKLKAKAASLEALKNLIHKSLSEM